MSSARPVVSASSTRDEFGIPSRASFDVVMSLFNKAAFVEATIASVIAQSFGDWRLTVVDDGSTDNGPELVEEFDDSRIILIRQNNQGVGPARNTGLHAGRADWVAFLDADDLWRVDHLAELDALRGEFPEAALIGCAYDRFCGSMTPDLGPSRPAHRRIVRYFAECARGRELFWTSSAAARRSALDAVGDFKPLPGNEDVEMWARLALYGPVAASTRKTALYRVATGGITDAGMGGRREAPRPMLREQLSSTIPTLTAALPGITDAKLRRDINDYMDSRIGLSLVAAVKSGDLDYARHLRGFYAGRPRGRAAVASALLRLPVLIARAVLRTAQRLKRS